MNACERQRRTTEEVLAQTARLREELAAMVDRLDCFTTDLRAAIDKRAQADKGES